MRDWRHETILERPEAESAGRRRSRDAKSAGSTDLLRLCKPTIRRYLRLHRETGDVEPRPVPGPPARKGAALGAALPAQAKANPDLTLQEHCELFEETEGVRVSTATMSRAFEKLGLPLKKVPPGLRA
jgi:transposase